MKGGIHSWGAQPPRLLFGAPRAERKASGRLNASVATDALRTARAPFAAPGAGALPSAKPVNLAIHLISACFFIASSAIAQDELPKLRPPRAEIPPTFWEQHGTAIVIAAIALVLVIGILAWILSRPKARKPIPPEVVARRELNALRDEPEDGVTLSRISQILRRHFADAFKLPSGELTTTEFCRAISDRDSIGGNLSGELVKFLRQCDERKFAPNAAGPPDDSVSSALKLIDQAEARRAKLHQAEAAAAANKQRAA